MSPRRASPSCFPWILLIAFSLMGLVAVMVYAPDLASRIFGEPSDRLNEGQRWIYALRLLWSAGDLTRPRAPYAPEQRFTVEAGESVHSLATRLEQSGLIWDRNAFRAYLIWSGQDTGIQASEYRLSASMTALEIARALQNPLPGQAVLVILPGWRMEEIATALPTTGLEMEPSVFLEAASTPPSFADLLPDGVSAEGFLYPDTYVLPRQIEAHQLISLLTRNFFNHLTPDLRQGFSQQGLTIYQAVTLASIIERETVVEDEMPLIASVFYNRLRSGMNLGSDPTVQYALGYNPAQNTWWTNPLSSEDLQIDSPYNTYRYGGLPPGPICNPSLTALRAVAFPAQSTYLYFRARCDGSGRHSFAQSYEEHQQNACR